MSDNSPSRSCDRITPDVLKKYGYRSENQKYILMCKTQSDEEHIYSKTNIEAALAAQRAFKSDDGAFRLYHRLSLHNPEYHFALSQKEIEDSIGLSANRYYKAVKKLIEAHYLEPIPGYPDIYIFYEYPQVDNPMYGLTSNQDGSTPPVELGVPSPTLGETPPVELGVPPLPNWEEPSCQIGGTNIVYISQDTVTNTTVDTTDNTSCDYDDIFIYSPEREDDPSSASGDLGNDSEPVIYDYIDRSRLRAIEALKRKDDEIRLEDLKATTGGLYFALYEQLVDRLFPNRKRKPVVKFKGWDEENNEPIMVWAPCYVPPHLMTQGVGEFKATWDGYNAASATVTAELNESVVADHGEPVVDVDFADLEFDDEDLPF